MVRISKQEERRNRCPKKRKPPSPKTGPKQDNLPEGYKMRANAVEGELAKQLFVGKVAKR